MNETVENYLDAIEGPRGEAMRAVFETVKTAMPEGYELTDFRGAPSWVVPLSAYPVTYNKQPLPYVALIAQKNYLSLYLMGLYTDSQIEADFRAAWAASGLKLDMGKSCVRFRGLADVDLGIVANTVAAMPVDELIAVYEHSRRA